MVHSTTPVAGLPMDLSDPALRKGATGKLARALQLAKDLRRDMDAWWAVNPVRLEVTIRDERFIDILAVTSPIPPVDDWYHRSADIMQNFRDALNRLTFAVSYLYTAPAKPRDASFPVRRDIDGWEMWRKKNNKLPDELMARFLAFQPYISGRPFLSALTDSNNIEKHEDGFQLYISLEELKADGIFNLEGLWEDRDLQDHVKLAAGEALDLESGRQLIGTIEMPTQVLDMGDPGPTAEFTVTPVIRYDDEEIPILPAIDLIGREVAWAIAYITGVVDNSKTPPEHLEL
ncbi:hypothetical protein OH146_11850 [Salinibacterium sp. SYSU T00001]|uniref:hypothetical protein n=1 Tax=Homoserinimonas sedimenticola TaxID=2986805 RepID=UPI002235BA56|nr:hypothetical protein [Salinibacterium sedimenticola]MCW4386466.1 hypothetical protein [Salinibacterium sedimenticola]